MALALGHYEILPRTCNEETWKKPVNQMVAYEIMCIVIKIVSVFKEVKLVLIYKTWVI